MNKLVEIEARVYNQMEPSQQQELRIEKALEACKFNNLTYFHKSVLKKMLQWDAHNRPNFLMLKIIFDDTD